MARASSSHSTSRSSRCSREPARRTVAPASPAKPLRPPGPFGSTGGGANRATIAASSGAETIPLTAKYSSGASVKWLISPLPDMAWASPYFPVNRSMPIRSVSNRNRPRTSLRSTRLAPMTAWSPSSSTSPCTDTGCSRSGFPLIRRETSLISPPTSLVLRNSNPCSRSKSSGRLLIKDST